MCENCPTPVPPLTLVSKVTHRIGVQGVYTDAEGRWYASLQNRTYSSWHQVREGWPTPAPDAPAVWPRSAKPAQLWV